MTYNMKRKENLIGTLNRFKLRSLTPSPYGLSHVKNEFSPVGLQCSLRPLKV